MDFLSYSNLLQSYKLARKSRKNKMEVYVFDLKLEENLLKMYTDIKNRIYIHGKYTKIILHDSKKRYIHSPNFRDHIFHHMMYKSLYETLDKKLIFATFACRKWYWSHKAILYIRKYIQKETRKLNKKQKENILKWGKNKKEKLYYLKIDISKYFYSINHNILEKLLLQYITDENLKYAVKVFLKSYETDDMFDDLFDESSNYRQNKEKWIPIGSIISQLFANFYLNNFDHFIKRELKIKNYFRYMDDFLFIWTKKQLQSNLNNIIHFLETELYLVINPKKISFNLLDDWISYVWYRIKNWKIYVWKRIIKWIQRFIRKLNETEIEDKYILKRLENVWQSRRWFFNIADYWENYIKKLNVEIYK